jgi:hypothetical protein
MFDIENVNRTTAQPPETFKMVLDAVEDPTGNTRIQADKYALGHIDRDAHINHTRLNIALINTHTHTAQTHS